jgi:MerR family transcriptional regulator, redox-sensitive transcriptional activator SoxR
LQNFDSQRKTSSKVEVKDKMKKPAERPEQPRELTVGQLAARSGVAASTIHFYESKGLIMGWRNAGNHRRYARAVLRRVALIKVAQRTGISLAAIRETLRALPKGRPATAQDWKRLSAVWRADLEDRIERLSRLRDQLDGCIGCGCLSLEVCPLRNAHDRLAKQGPGPRLLDP